jgi:hypothetical protein
MMTSTNVDSTLFREEMKMMKELITNVNTYVSSRGKSATIVPGHGDYYPYIRLLKD